MKDSKLKIKGPHQLMKRMKVQFNDVTLLTRALTHKSYLNEHPEALEDNERLEFLGDAVLDFIVGEWLYNRFPEMEEGDLTQMRSAFVQTTQLADFAREVKVESVIRLGKGEQKSGGRMRDSLLCDVFEALIGAMLLDQGIDVVRNFTYPFLASAVNEIIEEHRNEDPKSKLQEWVQAHGYHPPKYRTIRITGPDHAKVFEVEAKVNNIVVGIGKAKSKQKAEKIAAGIALDKLLKEHNDII